MERLEGSPSIVESSKRAIRRWMPVISGTGDLGKVPLLVESAGTEFCACEDFSVNMVAAVCREGFLPMGLELPDLPLLLVKVHELRAVLRFDQSHVSRNVPRYARGLKIFADRHFARTIAKIVEVYDDQWLIPPLIDALSKLHGSPSEQVRARSFEVYDGDEFVAGEVGYSVGPVYTSLSGFHRRNGAGTVQLVALSELLRRSGAPFWDLGMPVDYKLALGCELVARDRFLPEYRRGTIMETAESSISRRNEIELFGGPWDCEELVDSARTRERERRNGRRD